MKILCIGDIVGGSGRDFVREILPGLKKELKADFVIANGENAAGGFGITPRLANQLFRAECDVITLGDHVWDREELKQYLNDQKEIIRPANFPDGAPGRGWCVITTPMGTKIGVINLLGRVFMRYNVTCPFEALKKIVEEIRKETPIIVVDIHAEATSEKIALGHFIDGQVSCVFGTHTHVPTADEQVLTNGTAFVSDLGMTGPHDSVIGQKKEKIIERFVTSIPVKFEVAKEDIQLHGAIVDVDEKTGLATSIERVERKM